jgi:hypothetical protein
MTAKIISISKHVRYEHAYLTIYKQWIESRREADYKARGWALEPVPVIAPNSPSLSSKLYYHDLIDAYKTKLEVDSVIASSKGKEVQKPEIFSNDILRRCKLLDETIANNFGDDGSKK